MARNISYGTCEKCDHRSTKGHMLRHIRKCFGIETMVEEKGKQQFQLRIEAEYLPMYWLDIEIDADKKLRFLDKFLREIWLECCGHMSQFQINDYHYLMPYDGSIEIWEHEGDMCTSSKPLGHIGMKTNGDSQRHDLIIHRQESSSVDGVRTWFLA